jgi:hypothetical protein
MALSPVSSHGQIDQQNKPDDLNLSLPVHNSTTFASSSFNSGLALSM